MWVGPGQEIKTGGNIMIMSCPGIFMILMIISSWAQEHVTDTIKIYESLSHSQDMDQTKDIDDPDS